MLGHQASFEKQFQRTAEVDQRMLGGCIKILNRMLEKIHGIFYKAIEQGWDVDLFSHTVDSTLAARCGRKLLELQNKVVDTG